MSAQVITKEIFERVLKNKLGDSYDRAMAIFTNFGTRLSFDVTNVLLHAADQGREKVKVVLAMLEKHFEQDLKFQHPDIRGTIHDSLGINKTQVIFLDICQRVLNLKPIKTI